MTRGGRDGAGRDGGGRDGTPGRRGAAVRVRKTGGRTASSARWLRRQLNDPDAVAKSRQQMSCYFDAQACLADATRAHERDKTVGSNKVQRLIQLGFAFTSKVLRFGKMLNVRHINSIRRNRAFCLGICALESGC